MYPTIYLNPVSNTLVTFEKFRVDSSSATITGLYAQEINGAVIMVERELHPRSRPPCHWNMDPPPNRQFRPYFNALQCTYS
jgi:hypothetical protein